MTALVVGMGSIGTRHALNLLATEGVNALEILTKRAVMPEGLDHNPKVKKISSLDETTADFAVVANETFLHKNTASELIRRGMRRIFVEKPIAVSVEEARDLAGEAAETKADIFVGYNMRFLGAVKLLRKTLLNQETGRPRYVRFEAAQYLPDWRPNRDWRDTYSADMNKGGGVALDLSHEIDTMRYLFGEPSRGKTLRMQSGSLGRDIEDIFEGIYQYDHRGMAVSVHCDYLARTKTRMVKVVCAEGEIICDIAARDFRIIGPDGGTLRRDNSAQLFDMAQTYVEEMKSFVGSVKFGAPCEISAADGIAALQLLDADAATGVKA